MGMSYGPGAPGWAIGRSGTMAFLWASQGPSCLGGASSNVDHVDAHLAMHRDAHGCHEGCTTEARPSLRLKTHRPQLSRHVLEPI